MASLLSGQKGLNPRVRERRVEVDDVGADGDEQQPCARALCEADGREQLILHGGQVQEGPVLPFRFDPAAQAEHEDRQV